MSVAVLLVLPEQSRVHLPSPLVPGSRSASPLYGHARYAYGLYRQSQTGQNPPPTFIQDFCEHRVQANKRKRSQVTRNNTKVGVHFRVIRGSVDR